MIQQTQYCNIFKKDVLPICLQPNLEEEKTLCEKIKYIFGCNNIAATLYQFYIATLKLDPYKTVLYNSLDNHIDFSDGDTNKNNLQILNVGDIVFQKENINPDNNVRLSTFYCNLVRRLHHKLYRYHLQDNNEEIEQLLFQAEQLEKTMKDSNASEKQDEYQALIRYIDELQHNYIYRYLNHTERLCSMIQCSKNNNCKNYEKEELDNFVMQVGDYVSKKVYYAPKIGIKINELHSTITDELYNKIIDGFSNKKIDLKSFQKWSNYFQFYSVHKFINQKTQIEEKSLIAIEKIIKIPISIADWFDLKIYQLGLNNQEIGDRFKYCQMPRKIIVGIRPIMLMESYRYTPQSKIVILGYEIDSGLCTILDRQINNYNLITEFDNLRREIAIEISNIRVSTNQIEINAIQKSAIHFDLEKFNATQYEIQTKINQIDLNADANKLSTLDKQGENYNLGKDAATTKFTQVQEVANKIAALDKKTSKADRKIVKEEAKQHNLVKEYADRVDSIEAYIKTKIKHLKIDSDKTEMESVKIYAENYNLQKKYKEKYNELQKDIIDQINSISVNTNTIQLNSIRTSSLNVNLHNEFDERYKAIQDQIRGKINKINLNIDRDTLSILDVQAKDYGLGSGVATAKYTEVIEEEAKQQVQRQINTVIPNTIKESRKPVRQEAEKYEDFNEPKTIQIIIDEVNQQMVQSDNKQDNTVSNFKRNILLPRRLPKTETEFKLYEDIEGAFNTSPFIFSLYQFYTFTLGLNPYKTVLYNSIDNPMYFSLYDNITNNNYQILMMGNKIFKEDSIDPNDNQKFSTFYCSMIQRLNYISHSYHHYTQDGNGGIVGQLLIQASTLERQMRASTTNIRKEFYRKQYENVKIQLDRLQSDDISSVLHEMQKACQIIQCSKNNDCTNYDQNTLNRFLMITKDFNSQTSYKPRITFDISLGNLHSTADNLYNDIVGKIKQGKVAPEELKKYSGYFQFYDAHQFFGQDTRVEGKVIIAFKEIIKIPIKFGAWFDPHLYHISINEEMDLQGFDYNIYTQYCRIPKKIILGRHPAIIYSTTVRDFSCGDKHTGSLFEKNNISSDSQKYHIISKDHKNSLVMLGYEVDSNLCNTPLIEGFKNIAKPKKNSDLSYKRDSLYNYIHSLPIRIPFTSILNRFYKEVLKVDLSRVITFSSLKNLIYFSDDDADNYYQIGKFSDRIFSENNILPNVNKKFSELYCQMVQALVQSCYSRKENQTKLRNLTTRIENLKSDIKNTQSKIRRDEYWAKKIKLEKQLGKLKICNTKSIMNKFQKICDIIKHPHENVEKSKSHGLLMTIRNSDTEKIYSVPKVNFEADINDFPKKNTHTNIISTIFNSIVNFFTSNNVENISVEQMQERSDYFQSYEINFFKRGIYKTGTIVVFFDKVIKVPIKFPWFDPSLYQIFDSETVLDTKQDFSIFAEFCRMPEKVIIGINPLIIYDENHNPNNQVNTENKLKESNQQRYTIPKDSVVVLGYELNSDLCDSPLVGVFKEYEGYSVGL